MIPYAPQALLATISQYNLDSWPAHIPALLLIVLLVGQLFKKTPGRGRIASVILSIFWFWVAVFYFLRTYMDLNWVGIWLAEIFAFQGFLIFIWGIALNRLQFGLRANSSTLLGLIWLVLVMLVSPVVQYYLNKDFLQADYFAMQPDQLVALTLVFLLYFHAACRWFLLLIPLAWVLYSLIWSLMLGDASQMVLPLMSLALIAVNLLNRLFKRGRQSVPAP
ncbi:MAG: hypothetical protein KDJ38_13530 [Gammaproteobacteria bacterium]|nr:hypothetical protein [Gammaproteobacteria bacterium]